MGRELNRKKFSKEWERNEEDRAENDQNAYICMYEIVRGSFEIKEESDKEPLNSFGGS